LLPSTVELIINNGVRRSVDYYTMRPMVRTFHDLLSFMRPSLPLPARLPLLTASDAVVLYR